MVHVEDGGSHGTCGPFAIITRGRDVYAGTVYREQNVGAAVKMTITAKHERKHTNKSMKFPTKYLINPC